MCSYRVSLTVGHESASRAQGAGAGAGAGACAHTRDWRLYVCGSRGEDISRFVSKIVFTLHRSYTYPKRVIHEPPYEIRESGSGSFEVPIYIYIKQSTNPSKIKFRYKLFLHNHKAQSGSQHFSHVFRDPPEPVKTYLIQGGAEIVEPDTKKTETTSQIASDHKPDLLRDDNHVSKSNYLSKISKRAFNKLTDLFEPVDTNFADMDKISKVVTVNLDRVSEEQLKRKHYENVSVDSKKRKTDQEPRKYGELKPENRDIYTRDVSDFRSGAFKIESADSKKIEVKKNAINGVKVKNASKSVKSDVKNAKRTSEPPAEVEKLTEATIVEGLKKACKLVEMSSSEIDIVSQLYVSICKYEKNTSKDSLRLPNFADPVFQIPDLPPYLRSLLAETNDSYV